MENTLADYYSYISFFVIILSGFLGFYTNFKIILYAYSGLLMAGIIFLPFAFLHLFAYNIFVDYSLDPSKLIYVELGFYFLVISIYLIYSIIKKNLTYFFVCDLFSNGLINSLSYLFIKKIHNHALFDCAANNHEENLEILAEKYTSDFEIYARGIFLVLYIFLIYLLIKNTDDKIFYWINNEIIELNIVLISLFSILSFLYLLFIKIRRNIKIYNDIFLYVSILRLEGYQVIFTRTSNMFIRFKITSEVYDFRFNKKTYYYFLDLGAQGVWYYFYPKLNFKHFNHIYFRTSATPMRKFFLDVREDNFKNKK